MTKDKKKTKNDSTLKKFLASSPGSFEYITLRSELKYHFIDPGILEKSDLASNDLKEEARTILDAFEAITNGMYNPEVLSSMTSLSDNSLLVFWRELILAIKAFYEKNYIKMV